MIIQARWMDLTEMSQILSIQVSQILLDYMSTMLHTRVQILHTVLKVNESAALFIGADVVQQVFGSQNISVNPPPMNGFVENAESYEKGW